MSPAGAITIRPEEARDFSTIAAVTRAAFEGAAHSDGTEAHVIEGLRRDGDLALALVAEDTERLLGHIAFSPVKIGEGIRPWFGLGPVSVMPDMQGRGIGSALIEQGIADLRASGAKGIVVLGSPEFYSRFGFVKAPRLTFRGEPSEYLQCLVLDGDAPAGEVRYAPAFG